MARKIIVDPAKLVSAAGKMDTITQQYATNYAKVFQEVANLNAAWKGKDNKAFADRIEGFKADFDSMKAHLEEYHKFVKHSGDQYIKAQDEIQQSAGKLVN